MKLHGVGYCCFLWCRIITPMSELHHQHAPKPKYSDLQLSENNPPPPSPSLKQSVSGAPPLSDWVTCRLTYRLATGPSALCWLTTVCFTVLDFNRSTEKTSRYKISTISRWVPDRAAMAGWCFCPRLSPRTSRQENPLWVPMRGQIETTPFLSLCIYLFLSRMTFDFIVRPIFFSQHLYGLIWV